MSTRRTLVERNLNELQVLLKHAQSTNSNSTELLGDILLHIRDLAMAVGALALELDSRISSLQANEQ